MGSRQIKVPAGDLRPTQDMVREALFSILGNSLENARFLDLFAGSGAVGIEAWSRGAEFVCSVESNRIVLSTLKQNAESLCEGNVKVVCADVEGFLKKDFSEGYDVIFADPPYNKKGDGRDWKKELLGLIGASNVLNENGLFVFEEMVVKGGSDASYSGWELIKDKTYGKTRLGFFRKL